MAESDRRHFSPSAPAAYHASMARIVDVRRVDVSAVRDASAVGTRSRARATRAPRRWPGPGRIGPRRLPSLRGTSLAARFLIASMAILLVAGRRGRALGRRPARAQHHRAGGGGDGPLRRVDHRARRRVARRGLRPHRGRDRDAGRAPLVEPARRPSALAADLVARRPHRLQPRREPHRAEPPDGAQPRGGLEGRHRRRAWTT